MGSSCCWISLPSSLPDGHITERDGHSLLRVYWLGGRRSKQCHTPASCWDLACTGIPPHPPACQCRQAFGRRCGKVSAGASYAALVPRGNFRDEPLRQPKLPGVCLPARSGKPQQQNQPSAGCLGATPHCAVVQQHGRTPEKLPGKTSWTSYPYFT